MKGRQLLFRVSPSVLSGLLSLGLVVPLLTGPLPATHDGLHHLFRLFELDRSLRAWHLYPRVFADMGFGYGYPVLNFYSPLSYYLAWLGTAAGMGYIGGLKLAYALGAVAAALAMYGWTRSFLPAPGAFLAALAYTYTPYHAADVLVRGALAEATAFVWPPLLLWLLARYWRRRASQDLVWIAAATAGFVLTHNLTAFMFAPLLLLYALLLLGLPRSRACRIAYACLAGATTVGLALAAFYWLPALLEVRYVLAGTASGETELVGALQPLAEWLSPYPLHRYFPFQDTAGQHPLGIAQVATALAGLFAVGISWRRASRLLRAAALTATIFVPVALLLLTPVAAPAWRHLAGLSYLQFPWRLQAPLALVTASLCGCLALLPLRDALHWALAMVVSGLLAAGAMLGLRLEPAHLPSTSAPLAEQQVNLDGLLDYDFQTALWLREYGGEWLLEYLPVWALSERDSFFLSAQQPEALPALPEGGRLTVIEDSPLRTRLAVSLPVPATLVLHRFYFPGWTATADGRGLPVRPLGKLGLVAVDVPAGEHTLVLALGQTTPRLLGLALTCLAGASLAAFCLRRRLWWPLAVALALATLFLGLVWQRAARYPTTHRPQPLDARLGEVASLVGFATERSGAEVDVWLYWLALAPQTHDYRAFLHAVGQDGALVGQHDGQPGNEYSPTTRWLPGEIVPDRHALPLSAAGAKLYTGLYSWPDVVNLTVEQSGSDVPDRRVSLGTLHLP